MKMKKSLLVIAASLLTLSAAAFGQQVVSNVEVPARIQILNPMDPDPTVEVFGETVITLDNGDVLKKPYVRYQVNVSELTPEDQAKIAAALALFSTVKAIHEARQAAAEEE